MCFDTHRFIITADGSTEWVQPTASPLPPPVADTIDAAGLLSAELGGLPLLFPFGLQNAAQSFERLTLDVLAPPDDEFVGMLDYDYELLHDVLNEDLGDSSSDFGSHHPSQECFMANTPEGQALSASDEDDPSRTPNTGTAAGIHHGSSGRTPLRSKSVPGSKKLP